MFWASACVMALGLGFSQKNVTNKFDNGFMKYFNQLIKFIAHKLKKLFFTSDKKLNIGLGIILFPIFVYSVFSLKKPLEHSFVTGAKMYQSQTAQQYKIASWMKEHLHPKDGPIGFFTLGVSFHLAKFEIGDFLGKADELIANSPVKFGIAGHNKWDIEKSLQKWDFQAIIPEYNLDINNPTVAQNAKKILQEKTASGYSSELIFNDNLKQNFLYCYLKAGYDKELQDTFGFFLRKELSFVYLDDLFCRNISLDPPR
jgi:hypothetical protein